MNPQFNTMNPQYNTTVPFKGTSVPGNNPKRGKGKIWHQFFTFANRDEAYKYVNTNNYGANGNRGQGCYECKLCWGRGSDARREKCDFLFKLDKHSGRVARNGSSCTQLIDPESFHRNYMTLISGPAIRYIDDDHGGGGGGSSSGFPGDSRGNSGDSSYYPPTGGRKRIKKKRDRDDDDNYYTGSNKMLPPQNYQQVKSSSGYGTSGSSGGGVGNGGSGRNKSSRLYLFNNTLPSGMIPQMGNILGPRDMYQFPPPVYPPNSTNHVKSLDRLDSCSSTFNDDNDVEVGTPRDHYSDIGGSGGGGYGGGGRYNIHEPLPTGHSVGLTTLPVNLIRSNTYDTMTNLSHTLSQDDALLIDSSSSGSGGGGGGGLNIEHDNDEIEAAVFSLRTMSSENSSALDDGGGSSSGGGGSSSGGGVKGQRYDGGKGDKN